MKKSKVAIAIVLTFALGWFVGHKDIFSQFKKESKAVPIRQESSEHSFINPLLVIDNSDEKFPELNPLKKKFEKYIEGAKSNNKVSEASVYFRDLNTIKWTGVNENEPYSPASMLKVATLIAYLKMATGDQNVLLQKKYYEFQDDGSQFYKPLPLPAGHYSVLAILQQMIVNSDNSAMHLLENDSAIEKILQLYKELQIPTPVGAPLDFMSAMEYSRLFRMLYNSTYLPRSYSEQSLDLMTFTSFKGGITKLLPTNIKAAHKFGEQTFMEKEKIKWRELHDCGIVYYPNKPYVLCIMTKGQNFDDLEKVIADLSKIAFDYQNAN